MESKISPPPIETTIRQGFIKHLKEYFEVPTCVVVRSSNVQGAIAAYLATRAKQQGQAVTPIEYPLILLRPTTYAVNRASFPANRLARMGVYGGPTQSKTEVTEIVRRYGMVPVITQYELNYFGSDTNAADLFVNRVIMGSVRRGDLHFQAQHDYILASVIVNFDEMVQAVEITNGPNEVNQLVQQGTVQTEGFMSDYGNKIPESFTVVPKLGGVKIVEGDLE